MLGVLLASATDVLPPPIPVPQQLLVLLSQHRRVDYERSRERMFHKTLMRDTKAAQEEANRLERLRIARNKEEVELLRQQVARNEQHRLLELERKEHEGMLMKRQFAKAKVSTAVTHQQVRQPRSRHRSHHS